MLRLMEHRQSQPREDPMTGSFSHGPHAPRWVQMLFAALLIGSMTLGLATVPTAEAATIVVSPSTLAATGWSQVHGHCPPGPSTGSQAFVTGPGTPPVGVGSLQLTIGADGASFEAAASNALN